MKYLNELKNLGLPSSEFAVFGSGPLGIRELREVNDLDIIVKPVLWEKLIKKYPVIKDTKKSIQIGKIEVFEDWLPLFPDINELIDTADVFDGIRFVKLDYVLKWKKVLNREKDKEDIRLISQLYKSNLNQI